MKGSLTEYTVEERRTVKFRFYRYLSIWYKKLGFLIVRHPLLFITVPLIMSVALSTGLIYLDMDNDIEYLFVPEEAISHQDKLFIQKWFISNASTNFDPSRLSDNGQYVAVITTAKDGKNMLKENIFKDLNKLNEFIQNITIEHNGKPYSYRELCAENNGRCFENEIFKLSWKIKEIENKRTRIKFPLDYHNATYNYTIYVQNLGGVSVDESDFVEEVKALRLFYYLKNDNEEQAEVARKWERKFLEVIREYHFEDTSVIYFSQWSLENVLNENMASIHPTAIITGIVMLIYSFVSCLNLDLVTSKPWLGVAGFSSVLLSLASTYGLMAFCNAKFNAVAGVVFFLIFGIGMDDAFILISAWRQTNNSQEVPERMAFAYSEAVPSITITSVTNVVCFCVSVTIPIPAIRVFCLYAVTAIIFVFLYQITFFGGCMVYSGYREARNLNPFNFQLVHKNIEETTLRTEPIWKRKLHTSNARGKKVVFNKELIFKSFVRFFSKLGTKICTLLIIVTFLAICLWNTFQLKEGLDYSTTFPYSSASSLFIKMDKIYFSQFSYRLNVIVKETLDYSNPEVQNRIESLLQKLEDCPYIGNSSLTESWLRFYLIYLNMKEARWPLRGYNISTKEGFVDALWNVFLKYPQSKHLAKDLVFNENHTEILYSRFMVQTINLFDSEAEKAMLIEIRKIVEESKISLSVYNSCFPLKEQLLTIKETALRNLIIATIVTLATFFIFVPNILYSLCTALCVGSIEIGVIGIMSFWNVNLDLTSTTVLVMCVGLSIDYIAHMCFAYASSKESCWKYRYEGSVSKLGIPILQSASSTILGVAGLAFVDAYTYHVLFKLVFLVAVLSAVHALFVLPLLLNACDFLFMKKSGKKSTSPEIYPLNTDKGIETLPTVD